MNHSLKIIFLALAITCIVEGGVIRDAPYPPAVHSTYGVPEEIKIKTIPFVPEVKPVLEILDVSNDLLVEKLPELFAVPKVPEIKLEVPTIPATEYGLPEIKIPVKEEIKVIVPELQPTPVIPEIKVEVPAKEYGVPEEVKVIVIEKPKVFVPEGLPELPPAPFIPEIKVEVPAKEYGVPEIEIPVIPAKEYGVPEIFVPEGLPELPPAPFIPEIKVEVPAKEYGVPEIEIPAIPAKEYGVPEEIKVIVPEIPKVFVPEGLPELPPAPLIPEIKVEVPAKEYGVPEIEIEKIETPEIIAPYPPAKVIETPEVLGPYLPEKVIIEKPEITVIHKESKPYIPKPVVVEKVIEKSFPYPPAIPASKYGGPILKEAARFH